MQIGGALGVKLYKQTDSG